MLRYSHGEYPDFIILRLIGQDLTLLQLQTGLTRIFHKNKPTPSGSHTTQTVVLNTLSSLAHSSPPPNIFNTLAYSQAHFTAFSKNFSTDVHKVLFLAKKLTGHYCDWFSYHSVRNSEDVFPRPSKKVACVQAKPLQNLEDLAHAVDKRFVLAFPAEDLISPLELLVVLVLPGPETISKPTKNAGHMKLERSNLQPGEIGYQNLQPEVSQVANSSSPGVPQPKTIGFWSSLVETSEEGIRGNAHPESSEDS
ncbi:hypothetical protein DSO57_1002043 [Entomophthora muscae]|uniref:Uncharacterized protein n=1 Tax=Entomophthora muscae TaxID=34485 RepID=A0ACC2SBG3_9FUNG|nr:hypothetical protein DSO57_1002043 [Entomophthora muscae]